MKLEYDIFDIEDSIELIIKNKPLQESPEELNEKIDEFKTNITKNINEIHKLLLKQFDFEEFQIYKNINTAKFENNVIKNKLRIVERNYLKADINFKSKLLNFTLIIYLRVDEHNNYKVMLNHSYYPQIIVQDKYIQFKKILDRNQYNIANYIIKNNNFSNACVYLFKLNKIRLKNKKETLSIMKEHFLNTHIRNDIIEEDKIKDCIERSSLLDLKFKLK